VHLGTSIPAYQCRCAVRTRWFSLEAFRAGAASRDSGLPDGAPLPSPLTPGDDGFASHRALRA
jgi:hypothetical protein